MILRRSLAWLAALLLAFNPLPLLAATQSEFDKAVQNLQKNPDDSALRKKILKMARELKETPDIPDDVAVLKGKATYIVKSAKSFSDFRPAVDAYQEAILLAPWVPAL